VTGVGKVCILPDADKQLINLQPPCMIHYCQFTMSTVKFSLKHNIHNTAVSLPLGWSLSGVFWCELLPRVYYAVFSTKNLHSFQNWMDVHGVLKLSMI